jgi:hypothetical protein
MLAWLNNLLRRAIRTCRGGCGALPGAIRRTLWRLFGILALAWNGILSMRNAARSRLALELSIEHPAGKDRRCSVTAEGER